MTLASLSLTLSVLQTYNMTRARVTSHDSHMWFLHDGTGYLLLLAHGELAWLFHEPGFSIRGIHHTNGVPVSGETGSPVIHRFFTNFVSKFEQESAV